MTERVELLEAKHENAVAEETASLKANFDKELSNIIESVDNYLDKAISEFVKEAEGALAESVKAEKADLIIDALSAMMVSAGVEVSKIVEAKEASDVETKLAESIAKYDALVEETIAKDKEIEELIKIGVIGELKEGLTLVESEKFEKLAGLVEFSKDESYVDALRTIKESVKTSKAKEEPVVESVQNKKKVSSIDPRFL
jgi:putative heme iron utilization protein